VVSVQHNTHKQTDANTNTNRQTHLPSYKIKLTGRPPLARAAELANVRRPPGVNPVVCVRERERVRERHRERHRDRQTETDREKHTQRETRRETHRHTHRERERDTDQDTNRL